MKILVLGGTQFVGRAFVEAALAAGDELTLFHRGRTNPGLFPEVEHVIGDRDGGLGALDGRSWDACLDVSGYVPRLVGDVGARAARPRRAVRLRLDDLRLRRPRRAAATRTEPLATLEDETTEEIGGGTYGGLKVLCERVVTERVRRAGGDRAAGLRDRAVRPHRPVPRGGRIGPRAAAR